MKFAHSYWIKPALDVRYGTPSKRQLICNLYCNALSYSYIKNLGYTINLYADPMAADILSIIPYDNVTILDIPNSANPRFWAQGKFYALRQMELGEVHIDGDVMIKSNTIPAKSKLANGYSYQLDAYLDRLGTADAVVQSIEDSSMVTNSEYDICRDALVTVNYGNNVFDPSEICPTANTGVTQINNQNLKNAYIKSYFDLMQSCIDQNLIETADKRINFDVITEQLCLTQVCNKLGYTLCPLFDGHLAAYLKPNCKYYMHYISNMKYTMLNIIKDDLKRLNLNLYNKIETYLNKL